MIRCENCEKEHDGNYGSGRFCCKKCAKSYSAKKCNFSESTQKVCSKCSKSIIVSKNANDTKIKCDECKKSLTCTVCGSKYKKGGSKDCSRPEVCKKRQVFKTLISNYGFDKSTLGSELAYKEFDRIVSILYDDYYTNKMSTIELAKKYGKNNAYSVNTLFKTLGIIKRSFSEAAVNALETGRSELRYSNSYKTGWHTTWEGKKIFYRSSYELEFAQMLDGQKIKYEVEFLKIGYFDTQLTRQRLAIPDFYLPETNEIVEVKSAWTYDEQNMKDKFKAYQEHGYKYKLWLDKVYVDI